MSKAFAVMVPLLVSTAMLGGEAIAACTGNSLNQTQLATALTGNTACAVRGNDRWQELHQSGGALIDYKRGPSDNVDPSKQVGTWSIVGTGTNARVSYNYGTGGTFTYQVFSNGGSSYSFCNGTELLVSIKAGGGACP
jgi:hypothetical protein